VIVPRHAKEDPRRDIDPRNCALDSRTFANENLDLFARLFCSLINLRNILKTKKSKNRVEMP
jgi:hypothetical protein